MRRIFLSLVSLASIVMFFPVEAAQARPAPLESPLCAGSGLVFELDPMFVRNAAPEFRGRVPSKAELANFKTRAAEQFRRLLASSCRQGTITRSRLSSVKRVVFVEADGQEDFPYIVASDRFPRGTIEIWYAYGSERPQLAHDREMSLAIECWSFPSRKQCAREQP